MTERSPGNDPSDAINRRTFISTITLALSGPFAGCSAETESSTPTQEQENFREPYARDNHNEATRVVNKIERVYDRIEDVPLVEDGEFVYELEQSVGSVDFEEMVEMAKDAMKAAESTDEDVDLANTTLEHLQRTALIAFLLVDQRYLVHNVLLGGTVFRQAFTEGKYERAVEVIAESRQLLERLRTNGDRLEEEVAAYQNSDLTTEEVDVSSIMGNLVVLIEVLEWAVPTFEAFEHTATGMVLVEEGNRGLSEERYGIARDRYNLAQQYFSWAETAFDSAHGRGRSLEYLMPLVNDLRCFVPTLGTGYGDLDEAFSELEDGNEEQGLENARETMQRMNEEFSRCM